MQKDYAVTCPSNGPIVGEDCLTAWYEWDIWCEGGTGEGAAQLCHTSHDELQAHTHTHTAAAANSVCHSSMFGKPQKQSRCAVKEDGYVDTPFSIMIIILICRYYVIEDEPASMQHMRPARPASPADTAGWRR